MYAHRPLAVCERHSFSNCRPVESYLTQNSHVIKVGVPFRDSFEQKNVLGRHQVDAEFAKALMEACTHFHAFANL
jgi:hypothetical protein